MPTMALARADELHGDGQPLDIGVEIIAEDFFVLMQQRLALGRVEEHGIGLAGQLDVRGKAGPARAHDARLGDHLQSYIRHNLALYRRVHDVVKSDSIVYNRQSVAAIRAWNPTDRRSVID